MRVLGTIREPALGVEQHRSSSWRRRACCRRDRALGFDRLREIPPYDEDEEGRQPEAVLALREAIAGADAVLVATPEYNHSIPGHLKNALDWISRPLADTPLRASRSP